MNKTSASVAKPRPKDAEQAAVKDAADAGAAKSRSSRKRTKSGESRGKRNAELGRRGENAAARFLDRRGYEILERNWQCSAGEADIIARDGDVLVFVEVKTRSSTEKGLPAEAVDEAKRKRYGRIAALYVKNYEVPDVSVRFDVVSLLVIAPDRVLMHHYINAFMAG